MATTGKRENKKRQSFIFWKGDNTLSNNKHSISKHVKFPAINETRYKIFQPHLFFAEDSYVMNTKLFYPDRWLKSLEQTFTDLDEITNIPEDAKSKTLKQRAIYAYAHLLINSLTGLAFGDADRSVDYAGQVNPFNATERDTGLDWAYLGVTMVGTKRLTNVFELISSVVTDGIPGDFMETGVWRGGSSIFAASLFSVMHQQKRSVLVCDSFQGLPAGDASFNKFDIGWDRMKYVSVSDRKVARNFNMYGVLNENVYFVKGFFNDSMPHLAPHVDAIAVLRLDGDMYQSTVDVMYYLYDKVSVGGYVIVDDWTNFPAKVAVEDFFACHKISPPVIIIDGVGAYFKKTEQVEVQRWRYEKRRFKPTDNNDSQ